MTGEEQSEHSTSFSILGAVVIRFSVFHGLSTYRLGDSCHPGMSVVGMPRGWS